MCQLEFDTVFHTGDLVENGSDPELWETFNNAIKPLVEKADFYPVPGNHERESSLYYNQYPGKWYAVHKEDSVLVLCLNSNIDLDIHSEQYKWLKMTLESYNQIDAVKIATFHHPLFTLTKPRTDEKGLIKHLVPLFKKHGVVAVFSAHSHSYERFVYEGINCVVTGGGGAPLYDKCREIEYNVKYIKKHHFCGLSRIEHGLNVTVYDDNLNVLDEFVVNRGDKNG
jgi:3',5'-cyclic AMP phosphodiesterase CpdA